MTTLTSPARYQLSRKTFYTDVFGTTRVFDLASQNVSFGVGTDGRVGSSVPDWKGKVARKVDASSYYFLSRNSTDPHLMKMDWLRKTGAKYERWYSETSWIPSIPINQVDMDVDQRALTSLKRAFLSQRQIFNALAPVAELRELRGSCKAVTLFSTDTVRALLEIKRTKGRSALKYARDVWLGWGFGVSPLLSDVKNAAQALAARLGREPSLARISKQAQRIRTVNTGGTIILDGSAVGISGSGNLKETLTYRYTAGFDTKLLNAEVYDLPDSFGLNPEAVLPAAWELVPFSWVADYFFTVQNFFEDLFFDDGGSIVYITKSRVYTLEGVILYSPKMVPGTLLNSFSGGPRPFKVFVFERTPLGVSLPHVNLRFKSVDEIGIFSLNKLLNLASLLVK